MKKCDCFIGIKYDYGDNVDLHLDDYIETLKEMSDDTKDRIFPFNGTVREPIDYIDKRRGECYLFNYCPLCGEKINWKKLRKELRELS